MLNTDFIKNEPAGFDKTNSGYDIAIIGGGLAGLATSIQCAKAGYKVILFEKEQYPFHKVCGEYISLESWDFLESLGLALSDISLPVIHKLLVSAPNGKYLEHILPLGGFGISRYKLDAMLSDIAKAAEVEVMENAKVHHVKFDKDFFTVTSSLTGDAAGEIAVQSRIVAGAYGKRSNLDVAWKRKFVLQKANKLNNYIGVKYHIRYNHPPDEIALHNFSNGYCGISRIEGNKSCLCYLTTAKNLNENNNSIKKMEEAVLYQNPFLEKIFTQAQFIFESPLVISQISFEKKLQVEKHILMIGDAAGMITPLSGNGMSMALHAGKLAFEQMHLFLQKKISRQAMEENYTGKWLQQFSSRLRMGRMVQRFFGHPVLSNLLITSLKPFPTVINKLVSATHGQPF